MTIINMSGGKTGKSPVYQARTVQPTQFPTTVQPEQGYDALSSVQVNAPANLLAQNIRKDVSIAGVVGTYEATAPTIKLQQKTVFLDGGPTTVTPDEGYDGLSQVGVGWVNTCAPQNIKKGVNIFGVVGTYEGDVSNPSTGEMFYGSTSSSFSDYPKIYVGSELNVRDLSGTGTNLQNICTMGNYIQYCYVSGKWAFLTGGSCVYSQAFDSPLGEKTYGATPTSWTNTNRNTTQMDRLMRTIAGYLDTDYFSGTLRCYVGADVYNGDTPFESAFLSPRNQNNVYVNQQINIYYLRNVPFTYSNGNCTYTLSTSSTGALGVYPEYYLVGSAQNWQDPTDLTIKRYLLFHSVYIEV